MGLDGTRGTGETAQPPAEWMGQLLFFGTRQQGLSPRDPPYAETATPVVVQEAPDAGGKLHALLR